MIPHRDRHPGSLMIFADIVVQYSDCLGIFSVLYGDSDESIPRFGDANKLGRALHRHLQKRNKKVP